MEGPPHTIWPKFSQEQWKTYVGSAREEERAKGENRKGKEERAATDYNIVA